MLVQKIGGTSRQTNPHLIRYLIRIRCRFCKTVKPRDSQKISCFSHETRKIIINPRVTVNQYHILHTPVAQVLFMLSYYSTRISSSTLYLHCVPKCISEELLPQYCALCSRAKIIDFGTVLSRMTLRRAVILCFGS